jgi:N-acetylmuramoyl-L-alanine amidase
MARRKRKNKRLKRIKTLLIEIIILAILVAVAIKVFVKKDRLEVAQQVEIPEWVDVQLIDEGNPSRTGLPLDGINNIVVHYVGNPQTTAQQNRDYYNHQDSDVCSHFVVGIDGEIIMCVPLAERSSASNDRNHDTISIEVCHPDESGKFTDESYASLIKLVDWLMDTFAMKPDDVIRHYDVTGKECPLYYVKNPDAWEQFKRNL